MVSCVAMITPDWMSIAERIVAVVKALAVAEAKLCVWKLAVLLWAIVLSASCLHACWTPTSVG